ncbi:MAG TPA: protein kinase [Kofleriaceae bacterium]|nr:protein kinase [Kofleriaceae bacterium]
MIGQVVGSYRIVSELGKGGMGMVYRAEHVQLGRPAALKMLLPQFSTDPSIVQRFFNEARAASAIDHSGIVEIFDFGTHTDGSAYLVMAMLKGENLEQRLQRQPLPPTDGANILAQVAGALAAAHAQGIVHRDLKPDNIFLVPNDMMPGGIQVKLLDFGIAKLADEQAAGFKTQTGALMGTPAYMSPEQCMGKADIDHRTDLYALGCILVHVLCGRPPFTSEHGTGVMIAAHIRDPAPHPRTLNPQVPEALAAIAMRLLEKEPSARFQTATELRNALVSAGAEAPTTRPPGSEQFAATLPPTRPPITGPEAFAATNAASGAAHGTSPTTHGGAAAELVTSAPAAPDNPRRLGMMIALGGVLLAGAGVAAFLAVRSAGTDAAEPGAVATPAAPAPSPPPEPEPNRPVEPSSRPATSAPATVSPAAEKPREPSRETPQRTRKPPEPIVEDPRPPADPRFRLGAASYQTGESIDIKFAQPITSTPTNRAWITVVEADKSDSSYGTWSYLADKARTATLKAPSRAGAYEVRLHTGYPAKRTNVVHEVAVTITSAAAPAAPVAPVAPAAPAATPAAAQRFTLAASTIAPRDSVELIFAAPMHANPGERFWATLVGKDKPDTAWGTYDYVPAGAARLRLKGPPSPGDYEVRLHANYPKKTTNVVHRVSLTVQ